jgi:hypothetical protein
LLPFVARAQAPSASELPGAVVQRGPALQWRKEQRDQELARVRSENPGLARYLAIEPEVAEQLLQLLTEQHLTDRGRVIRSTPQGDAEELEVLRTLLSDEQLQRYQSFQETRQQRQQVAAFEERLAAADRLTAGQSERMVELLLQAQLSASTSFVRLQPYEFLAGNASGQPALFEHRREQLNVYLQEDGLRVAEAIADLMLQRLPQLLSSKQVRVYAEWQALELNRRRGVIEELRRHSGLPQAMPELPSSDTSRAAPTL